MRSTIPFIRFFLIFISITLFSCNKESATIPEISFQVDDNNVVCRGAEKVYGLYYLTQDKLSISANSNIVTFSGEEEIYDVKFIIEHVKNLNELIDVEIPVESSVNNPENFIDTFLHLAIFISAFFLPSV